MSEIQRYRFVVEREQGQIARAYAAPWFGSQTPENDYVHFSDLAPYVEARVKEAVEKEREVLNRENGNLRRIVGEQSVRHRMKLEERDYTIARLKSQLKALVDANMKVLNSQAPQPIVIQEAAVRAAQEKEAQG